MTHIHGIRLASRTRKSSSQSFLCHRIHELSLFFLDFSPFPTDSGDGRECAQPEKWAIFIPQILQKSSAVGRGFPICESIPLATDNVHQSIRTETKLPPRSRVNCSGLSAQAACQTLPLAHRSYSYSS